MVNCAATVSVVVRRELKMGTAFWVRRYFFVWGSSLLIIAGAHLVRGRGISYAISEGALWGLITATVFVGARIWQSRRKQHCAICRDTPEMRQSDQTGVASSERTPSP